MGWLASLVPALVGAMLVWTGGFKLVSRRAGAVARRTALPRLVGAERAVPVFRAVGLAEAAVGGALLLPPLVAAEAAVATALCLGFMAYLGYARVVAPESSCGCMGDRHAPVRWRAFARAGLLAALSALGVLGDRWWGDAFATRPVAGLTVAVGFAGLVVALSEDLDRYWLLPLRRLRLRVSHPLGRTAGSGFEVPVASTVHQLLRSPAYAAAGGWVRSDLLDSWDEGEWRVLNYAARLGERAATAVFAVPRLRYEPAAVRAVLVDESDQTVLWEHTPHPTPVTV